MKVHSCYWLELALVSWNLGKASALNRLGFQISILGLWVGGGGALHMKESHPIVCPLPFPGVLEGGRSERGCVWGTRGGEPGEGKKTRYHL